MPAPAEWTRLLTDSARYRPGVHVTDCLGCPRKKAYARKGEAAQLERLERRLEGTILHWALARVDEATAERPVMGTLWGLDIVGSVDRLVNGWVSDYKNPDGKNRPDGAYPEQVWQMECYRVLLAQMKVATVGWRLHVRWKGEWLEFSHEGPLWTAEQLGRFVPHSGEYAAMELAHMAQMVEEGHGPEAIPKAGATQRIGAKTACGYCEYEATCGAAAPPMVEF